MRPGWKWLLLALSLAIVGAFFVLREHWTHVLGFAPYLLLLACPLLPLFHGHSRGQLGRHCAERASKEDAQ